MSLSVTLIETISIFNTTIVQYRDFPKPNLVGLIRGSSVRRHFGYYPKANIASNVLMIFQLRPLQDNFLYAQLTLIENCAILFAHIY